MKSKLLIISGLLFFTACTKKELPQKSIPFIYNKSNNGYCPVIWYDTPISKSIEIVVDARKIPIISPKVFNVKSLIRDTEVQYIIPVAGISCCSYGDTVKKMFPNSSPFFSNPENLINYIYVATILNKSSLGYCPIIIFDSTVGRK